MISLPCHGNGFIGAIAMLSCMRQLSQGSIGIVDVDTSGYATAQPTRWRNVWALFGPKVTVGRAWGRVISPYQFSYILSDRQSADAGTLSWRVA